MTHPVRIPTSGIEYRGRDGNLYSVGSGVYHTKGEEVIEDAFQVYMSKPYVMLKDRFIANLGVMTVAEFWERVGNGTR